MFTPVPTGHAPAGTPVGGRLGRARQEGKAVNPVRVIITGLYIAAVVLAVTEVGRAVGVVVAVVGAAFVLLAFAATGADRLDGAPRRITRRRRRA
jgi:hypothetical protein